MLGHRRIGKWGTLSPPNLLAKSTIRARSPPFSPLRREERPDVLRAPRRDVPGELDRRRVQARAHPGPPVALAHRVDRENLLHPHEARLRDHADQGAYQGLACRHRSPRSMRAIRAKASSTGSQRRGGWSLTGETRSEGPTGALSRVLSHFGAGRRFM